ncbi:MAG: UvrB/UvrC motif-containing protein [Planctomycetota bacterium]
MLTDPDITVTVSSGGLGGEAALSLPASVPASHGIVCFRKSGAAVSVIASADMRSLVLDRLGPEAGREHDLRGSCDEVLCWSAGSSFEADLRFMDVAAEHAPDLARQASARLTVWWLAVDHSRPGDGWTITDEPSETPEMSVLGPFLDRTSARRWSEMLDDVFELCRYPAELRKAPAGTACAYHEMGRCPAACNGSEPISAYADRLRQAVRFDESGIEQLAGELRESMQRASAEADFERAGAVRDRLDALPAPDERWVRAVGAITDLHVVAIVPPRRGSVVELLRVGRHGWSHLGAVDARAAESCDAVKDMLAKPGPKDGASGISGVLAREMIRPRRGGPTLLRWCEADIDRVWSAARRAAKIETATDEETTDA